MHSIKIASIALGALTALSSVAFADAYQCKDTETQPECFARLKCHDDEELEDCQKRLRAEHSNSNGNSDNNDDRDHDNRDNDNRDRGRRDRNDDRDRGQRDRNDDRDRGHRDRRGGRSSGRRRSGGGGGGGHAFEANKTFGLGLELGEPTGLTGKYFFSSKAAFDFGVGYMYDDYYYGDGAHLYGDFLYHPISLASTDAFELPLFIGVGLRYWSFDYCDRAGVCAFHDSSVGIRIPFGLAFDFNNSPIDIFLQLVPVVDFVGDDYYNRYGDRTHAGIDGSVGFRFWFR